MVVVVFWCVVIVVVVVVWGGWVCGWVGGSIQTGGVSGLCCCVTSFERLLTPLTLSANLIARAIPLLADWSNNR